MSPDSAESRIPGSWFPIFTACQKVEPQIASFWLVFLQHPNLASQNCSVLKVPLCQLLGLHSQARLPGMFSFSRYLLDGWLLCARHHARF